MTGRIIATASIMKNDLEQDRFYFFLHHVDILNKDISKRIEGKTWRLCYLPIVFNPSPSACQIQIGLIQIRSG